MKQKGAIRLLAVVGNKYLNFSVFFKEKMKIGLDFDGVISDAGELKKKYIRILYEIGMPIEETERAEAVRRGVTNSQYTAIQRLIYNDKTVSLSARIIPHAIDTMKRLSGEGHSLTIITSRYDIGVDHVREWLRREGFGDLEVANTQYTPKTDACRERGIEVFLDDDLPKLEPLVGTVPHPFLFTAPYNKDIEVPSGIGRVKDWNDFYEKIKGIN